MTTTPLSQNPARADLVSAPAILERPAPALEIRITQGAAALELLQSDSFAEQWRSLQQSCRWATAFQTLDFVAAWYAAYREQYEPVLVQGYSPERGLAGLLTLARPRGGRDLLVAGTPQSEYQVWLAAPLWSEAFPRQALARLSRLSPCDRLTFEFLPSSTPLDWMSNESGLSKWCRLEVLRRPLIDLRDPHLKKKLWEGRTIRSHWHRLQRTGKVTLERITDLERFASLLGEMAPCYDVRIGALTGLLPFRRHSQKKAFLLKLMETPNLLHVTCLRVGSDFLAANVGFCYRDTVGLDLLAYSPFHARYSPGKIHVLLLAERLAEEGLSALDLTPDGDWKDRLASAQAEVRRLTVYLRRSAAWRQQLHTRVKGAVRWLCRIIGVDPQSIVRGFRRARLVPAPGPCAHARTPQAGASPSGGPLTAVEHLDDLLSATDGLGREDVRTFLSAALKGLQGKDAHGS
jgi:CelD/BcsL family acetyltransferase involved in cellulose biosynthesis